MQQRKYVTNLILVSAYLPGEGITQGSDAKHNSWDSLREGLWQGSLEYFWWQIIIIVKVCS